MPATRIALVSFGVILSILVSGCDFPYPAGENSGKRINSELTGTWEVASKDIKAFRMITVKPKSDSVALVDIEGTVCSKRITCRSRD
jgi:hypothetical protein